jgi:hypothetical protein
VCGALRPLHAHPESLVVLLPIPTAVPPWARAIRAKKIQDVDFVPIKLSQVAWEATRLRPPVRVLS